MDNGGKAKLATKKTLEQRKHTRVKHSGSVIVNAGGGTFSGSTVNISRSGMQVMVNMPASYHEVQSITFSLPASSDTLEVPCRLVRMEKCEDSEQDLVLGVKIDYQTEAQMLLIENFIRDTMQGWKPGEGAIPESRLLPRSQCMITGVATNRPDLRVLSIDNISCEGLLLRFIGELESGEVLELEFCLPEDGRKLKLSGKVMYVIRNEFQDISAAGITLQNLSEIDRTRIKNFIIATVPGVAIRSVYKRFSALGLGHEFRVADPNKIRSTFLHLFREGIVLNALFEGNLQILELRIGGLNNESGTWSATRFESFILSDSGLPKAGYFSFSLNGGSHYFRSEFAGWQDGAPVLLMPPVLFRSEKRSYCRKNLITPEEVTLSLGSSTEKGIQGKLLDISRHGFLCEIPQTPDIEERLSLGLPLEYSLRASLGLSHHGEIRHLSRANTGNGDPRLRIGIAAGVVRSEYAYRSISSSLWSRKRTGWRPDRKTDQRIFRSEVMRYYDRQGHEIVALVNRSEASTGPSPVVILPPAFGKKKEAMAVLAATLVANFRRRRKNLVVLRYDGINRPGESYSQDAEPKRGYEMLHYRISQGLEDLQASLDFVHNNPHFRPAQVVLVSCSMSAIDCRRLLAKGDNRIHHWVSLMGVACAQSVLKNTLGGLDIIGNARMQIPNGINGLLGHLVDMDTLAGDLIENRYAYLTDARQDMSRIPVPVLWIYGRHDRWISPEEIADIMSVRSNAYREVMEVPTGHNLRNSEEALHTFLLITSWLYKRLYKRELACSEPDHEQLMQLITWERERLVNSAAVEPQAFWKTYLLGTEHNSQGYDFYRNFSDFRAFLSQEAAMAYPEQGGMIADMGCGTGLVVEQLLERVALHGHTARPITLTAVDLVPEALERTRHKWEQALRKYSCLQAHRLECAQMDLTPNRLLPVRAFLTNPSLPLGYLRNRVEGLTAEILAMLDRGSYPKLRNLLSGESISPHARSPTGILFFSRNLRSGNRLQYGRPLSAGKAGLR